jgi:hypothetical protein
VRRAVGVNPVYGIRKQTTLMAGGSTTDDLLPTKDVVLKYFTACNEESGDKWKCRCGKNRAKGRGWSNLMDHLTRAHSDTLGDAKKKETGPIVHFFPKKNTNLFGWVQWIVSDLLPFSFCERPMTRKFTRLSPISTESLLQAMNDLTTKVENKIRKRLPSVFAVMFDGWSSGGTHYLSVFAVWPDSKSSHGYSRALLSFTPLVDERDLSAQSHKDTLYDILRFYGKDYSNLACLIGDNCATNRSLARLAKVFFVGCASHRLGLGVKAVLASYSELESRIHTIMAFLRTIKGRAALRTVSNLSPVLSNSTRWSSVKHMFERYTKICNVIGDIVPADIQLSPADNRSVETISKTLSDLNVLTNTFQDESMHMCYVRDYLDAAVESFPEIEQYCSENSGIIEDKSFESAVVKIQKAQLHREPLSLTRAEMNDVKHLMKPEDIVIETASSGEQGEESELCAALRRIKKRRVAPTFAEASKYLDLRFIRPITNICERMFSVSGFAFTKNRQGLLPVNLEMQLFLKANAHIWDASLFHATE